MKNKTDLDFLNRYSVELDFGDTTSFKADSKSIENFVFDNQPIELNGYKLKACMFSMDENTESIAYKDSNNYSLHQLKDVGKTSLEYITLQNVLADGVHFQAFFPEVRKIGDHLVFNFYMYVDKLNEFIKIYKRTKGYTH